MVPGTSEKKSIFLLFYFQAEVTGARPSAAQKLIPLKQCDNGDIRRKFYRLINF
jgi:hypothetical protein